MHALQRRSPRWCKTKMPGGFLWFGEAVELKLGPKLRLQLFSRAIFKQYQFHPEMQRLPANTPTHQAPKMPAYLLKASAWCQRAWRHTGWRGTERTRPAENSDKIRNKTASGLLWANRHCSSSP